MNGSHDFLRPMILAVMLLILSNAIPSFGQAEKDIMKIMSKSDWKRYERAEDYKSDGDTLIEESNRLNSQIVVLQKNYDLDEKEVQQEVSRLESEIYIKQFDAALDYQKCNEIRYNLLKHYSKKSLKNHSDGQDKYVNARVIEEQAGDFYSKARTKIRGLRKVRDKREKITTLKEANDLGSRAVKKMVTALRLYYEL